MDTVHKLSRADIGTLVNDHHGIYVYEMVCEMARSWGWQGDMPDMDDVDDMVFASDDALAWVNENVCDEGVIVGWYEGAIVVDDVLSPVFGGDV